MNTSILELEPKSEPRNQRLLSRQRRPLGRPFLASHPSPRSRASAPCWRYSSSSFTSRPRTSAFSIHSSTTATSLSASSSSSPGYVLTYNYADRGKNLSKREFWLARFSRLYPVYLLVLIISVSMLQEEWQARSHAEFWQGIILTPFVLQGWSPSVATFWNTVAWTLTSECVLYAAFPWLIRLPWPKKPLRLVALLITLWIVGLLPHTLYLYLNPDHIVGPVDRYSSSQLIRFLKYTPLPYVCTFLSGVTLGKLQLALVLTPRQRLVLSSVSLAIVGIFFYFLVGRTPYLLMHGGLMTPVFAALVLGLSGPHPISALFSWRPLLLIGESSYCLYLLHFNVFQLLHTYHVPERLHLAALDPWLSYAILILLALAVFRFVEIPARRAILNRFSRKPRTLLPAA